MAMRPLAFFALAVIVSGSMVRAGQAPTRPSAAQPSAPQEPIATFRAGVRAIQVDAVVTDTDGNPVRGLTSDDFEVTERGKPQPITTFEAVDIPIQTQPPDLADSDVATNEGEGRIYLIVVDDIQAINAQRVKRELRKFLADHFGPSDVAAIMFLDRAHVTAGQSFTSNRRLLIEGIDSIVGYSADDCPGPLCDRVMPGSASPILAERPGERNASEAAVVGAPNRMERLRDLTEFLLKIPGPRKAMVLVTEAIGFDATDFQDYAGTSMTRAGSAAHAAMTAATRGNIAIYPIHPGGVADEGGLDGVQKLSATMELRTLAAATGGFALVSSNNYDDAFTRLVQEQSVYYMLGFNSGEEKDNGRYVPVTVTVKRPGLKVLAREGYVAPFKGKDNVTSPERRPGVGAALASPIAVGGVSLKALAAPFRGKGKTASVLVALEMDAHRLGLTELPGGGLRGSVELRMAATDVGAKVLPQMRQLADISVAGSARERVERGGLHILTKTELRPGRYQLRIAIGTTQRGGSVVYDLDVPDYSKKELSMSAIVLRGPNPAEGVSLPTDDPLRTLTTRAPATTRAFGSDDTVTIFAEIYDNTGTKPHRLDVTAAVRSESGAVTPVFAASPTSSDLQKTGNALLVDAPLPLAKLAAGRYVLSVTSKSSAGGDSVTRTVPFRVR